MKRILLLLITVSFIAACSSTKSTKSKAKVFNGKIVYSLSYDGDVTPAQIAQMPKTVEITTMEGRMKTEVILQQGSMTTIVNEVSNSTMQLYDFGPMGRFAVKDTLNKVGKDTTAVVDTLPQWKEELQYTEETKTIQDYTCKKIVVTETKEGEDDRMYNVFYCPDLGVMPKLGDEAKKDTDKNIPGLPLEFVMYNGGMKITYKATSVKKGGIKELEFFKPTDFKLMTQEELMEMFGGGQ